MEYKMKIEQIERYMFLEEKFDFIVGECATYNTYYKITLDELDLIIGLQTCDHIKPKVSLYKDRILLGIEDKFCIYEYSGKLYKEYEVKFFYDFSIINDKILVAGTLDLYLLNSCFDVIWHNEFNEMIVNFEVKDSLIKIEDYDGAYFYLDCNTGKRLKSCIDS